MKKTKGSMTVEAALAFPILFFSCMAFLYIFQAYFLFGRVQEYLHQEAVRQSRIASRQLVVVNKDYDIALPATVFSIRKLHSRQVSVTYSMQGKSIVPKEGSDTEEYVYITPNGEVYHRSIDCVYLKPSIREMTYEEAAGKRNASGGIYHPCERCVVEKAEGQAKVFITTYGDRYHINNTCPGLKRTIYQVAKEAAGDKRPCSKCGMAE